MKHLETCGILVMNGPIVRKSVMYGWKQIESKSWKMVFKGCSYFQICCIASLNTLVLDSRHISN